MSKLEADSNHNIDLLLFLLLHESDVLNGEDGTEDEGDLVDEDEEEEEAGDEGELRFLGSKEPKRVLVFLGFTGFVEEGEA